MTCRVGGGWWFRCLNAGRDSGLGWVVTQSRVELNRSLWQWLYEGGGSLNGREMDS